MAEGEEPLQCRICFDGKKRGNPLITPCVCKGSSKYVHRKCLEAYRSIEPVKGLYCSVCKEKLATTGQQLEEDLPDCETLQSRFLVHPYVPLVVLNYVTFFFGKSNLFLVVTNGCEACIYVATILSSTTIVTKKKYWLYWNVPECWLLLCAHLFLLSCWQQSPTLASIANSLLLSVYYHHHCFVVQWMNNSLKVTFASRKEVAQ